jgi:hypothetical protein
MAENETAEAARAASSEAADRIIDGVLDAIEAAIVRAEGRSAP